MSRKDARDKGLDLPLAGSDPEGIGHSMANLGELIYALLEAVDARLIVEVGAYDGELTAELATWAEHKGASIVAVDPEPRDALRKVAARSDSVELDTRLGIEVIPDQVDADVIIIDGDHNYYTVSSELRALEKRLRSDRPPLVLLHDVCWPHGRRDSYYEPSRIPSGEIPGRVSSGCVVPGNSGLAAIGIPYPHLSEHEGGAKNGVLTAVEDFNESHGEDITYAVVPAFFGLGVLWSTQASWNGAINRLVKPLDHDPVLSRLERNRVENLTNAWTLRSENEVLRRTLRDLEQSRALRFADMVARLRYPSRASSWREKVGNVLAGSESSSEESQQLGEPTA